MVNMYVMWPFWLGTVVLLVWAGLFLWPIASAQTMSRSRKEVIMVFLLLISFTYTLYGYWGESINLAKSYQHNQRALSQKPKLQFLLHHVKKRIAWLRLHIETHPKESKAWWDLGRLYLLVQEPHKAVSALEIAQTLDPKNIKIQEDFRQALVQKQEMEPAL